ncbi:MAG: TonB-dependent receptor plug domain-containing protein [Muribaculaceae bacterium]|nr:TonB-dependent receptor plug domain-containing protein [Muribaculaceae bacterium]
MKFTISDIFRQTGLNLLLVSGCLPAGGTQPDSLYNELKEMEVVTNRVKKEVTSSAPLFHLNDEKMKTLGVTDLTDALHRMPGLNIRDYGGAGGMKTVSVRGFGTTHTGVIYDGVALSDAQNGSIDLSRYSLDNVDDLSLLIGDNNNIFTTAKASASAATIVINTGSVPSPGDSLLHLDAQLRIGSFKLINPYIKIAKSLTRNFSFAAAGEYTYAKNNYPYTIKNGLHVTHERRDNSRMNSGHIELNTRWRPNRSSSLDAKLYFYDNDRQLPGPVVLYNTKSDDTLHDKNFFGQLTYNNSSLTKFRFRGVAKFNWDATYYHEVDGKYTGGYKDENYLQREAYISGAVLYSPLENCSFSYAADYIYNNLSSNLPSTVGPRRHSILQNLSAQFRTDHISLTGRLLYSVFTNSVKKGESVPDQSKLSPSLNVSVQPWRSYLFFIRGAYKNIFRIPTFNESYYYHLGSLSLKPEETDQFNLGLTWQYGPKNWLSSLTLTGDVYYNKVKDKIVAIPMNMFVWSMTNLDKVRAFGADLTLEGVAALTSRQKLLLAGNYSWQRVQPRTSKKDPDYNKQVAYTPVHSGAISLTWQNPWVDVVVKTTGTGERYGTNSNLPISRLKGYMELGASLMRRFPVKRAFLDVRLDMLNLLDTQYEIVAAYPMPGRTFQLTLGFKL